MTQLKYQKPDQVTPSLGDSDLEIDKHLMIWGNKAVKISQNMKECKNVIMVAMVKAAAHFEEADVCGKLFICTQCSAAR